MRKKVLKKTNRRRLKITPKVPRCAQCGKKLKVGDDGELLPCGKCGGLGANKQSEVMVSTAKTWGGFCPFKGWKRQMGDQCPREIPALKLAWREHEGGEGEADRRSTYIPVLKLDNTACRTCITKGEEPLVPGDGVSGRKRVSRKVARRRLVKG